jgi:hypothetical protein
MANRKPSMFALLGGLLFTLGGLVTIWSGRLQSATVQEFGVRGLPARIIGGLFAIMGVMLLFDWIRKKRAASDNE